MFRLNPIAIPKCVNSFGSRLIDDVSLRERLTDFERELPLIHVRDHTPSSHTGKVLSLTKRLFELWSELVENKDKICAEESPNILRNHSKIRYEWKCLIDQAISLQDQKAHSGIDVTLVLLPLHFIMTHGSSSGQKELQTQYELAQLKHLEAETESPSIQYVLSIIYSQGLYEMTPDPSIGMELCLKAALNGYLPAQLAAVQSITAGKICSTSHDCPLTLVARGVSLLDADPDGAEISLLKADKMGIEIARYFISLIYLKRADAGLGFDDRSDAFEDFAVSQLESISNKFWMAGELLQEVLTKKLLSQYSPAHLLDAQAAMASGVLHGSPLSLRRLHVVFDTFNQSKLSVELIRFGASIFDTYSTSALADLFLSHDPLRRKKQETIEILKATIQHHRESGSNMDLTDLEEKLHLISMNGLSVGAESFA